MENKNSPKNFQDALEILNNILNTPAKKIKEALIKREERIKFMKSYIKKLELENQELKRKLKIESLDK